MKRFIMSCLISGAMLAATACGSDPAGHPLVKEAAAQVTDAACSKIEACFPDTFASWYGSASGCEAQLMAGVTRPNAASKWTRAQVSACVNAYRVEPCPADVFAIAPSECMQ
jgi:hypothetical protein